MKWYWYWMCAYFRFWYTVQNIWQSPKWMPARLIPSITCEDYTASNDINSFQTLKCGSYLNNLSSLRQYGRIARMDNSADAKISTASQLEEWKRPPGRSRVTLAKTFLDDVKSYNLTLTEAVNVAQNRPIWKLRVTYATHSCDASQKMMMTIWGWRAIVRAHHLSHYFSPLPLMLLLTLLSSFFITPNGSTNITRHTAVKSF